MMPPLPYKPSDYAEWSAPKLLPTVIPNVETIPAPPDTGSGKNSTAILYVAIGVLAIGGTIVVLHLISERAALHYQLQELTGEVKTLSALHQQEQAKNYLLTNHKSEKHEQTT